MNLTNKQRIGLYSQAFPKFEPLYLAKTGRIEGLWFMGNNYTTSGYYGAYPHGYMNRILSMFPDAQNILHAPSGSIPPGQYTRVDIREEVNPDIVGDVHLLPEIFREVRFDLTMADIPYSVEDAEHYGKPMVQRNKVLQACLDVTESGGWIVWLDQVLPLFNKKVCSLELAIGMIKSTNHRVRAVFGFKKL